jgi:NAD+ synthase (glutamine-hydrolysing)
MKIALAQMEVKPNQPGKNLEKMLEMIGKAKEEKVDLIAFPELCISGYLVGDRFTDEAYCSELMKYNDLLKDASDGIAIVYGNIFVDKEINVRTNTSSMHPNKDGRSRKYNAVYAFQDRMPVSRSRVAYMSNVNNPDVNNIFPEGVQPKTLLPTYRFFDDERYFYSAKDISIDFGVSLDKLLQPFNFKDKKGRLVKIGLEVCEDLWCEDYRLNNESLDATRMLIDNGAEAIINVSASPWTYGKNAARDRRIQFLKNDTESSGSSFKPFYYVNCTGAQNNGKNIITFDGGSTIYNSDAKPVAVSEKSYAEELMIADIDAIDSMNVSHRSVKSMIAEKYDAIITGIRHSADMLGREELPKFMIGLSGGVDSAVVAALLCQAVGSNKVTGINLPTKYNSNKTKNAAYYVARKLGMNYAEIPIQQIVDTIETVLDAHDVDGSGRKLSSLNCENIQAKVRGTDILSNIASKYGAFFTNNGNKLETALGYATLYGDVNGVFAPIADLLKEEVFMMAHYLNDEIYHDEIIPNILLPDELFRFTENQIQPSAELKEKQVDPMKFGYHDRLLQCMLDYKKTNATDIMQWYIDGTLEKNLGISTALIQRWNIDNPKEFVNDLEWFEKLMQSNVFKRIQSPPLIVTSKTAFGYDLRESILPYFESDLKHRLKSDILKMDVYHTCMEAEK